MNWLGTWPQPVFVVCLLNAGRACERAAAEPARPSEPASAPVEIMPPQTAPAAWNPASAAAGGLAGFGGGAPGGPSRADQARQMRQTAAMLRINPGMAQHVMSAAANITPEQMQAAVRREVSMLCNLTCGQGAELFPAESQAACIISSMMSQVRPSSSKPVNMAGASCGDPGRRQEGRVAESGCRRFQGETPASPSCTCGP